MTTLAARLARIFSPRQTGGVSRLGALGFFLISVAGATITLSEPQVGRWTSAALLVAIGILALLMLIAAWPRRGKPGEETSRAASAAAASNVAWAVTSKDGAVLDCNAAYRALVGSAEGEHPAPPQHGFPGKVPAAALYRLSRAATEGSEREETFETEAGQKLTASVKPLKHGEAAWWFTPRLIQAAPAPKLAVAEKPEKPVPSALIRFSDFFRNAPVGVAITTPGGDVLESNAAFAEFFALGAFAAGAKFGDLVSASEKQAALKLIARAASGETSHEPEEVHCGAGSKSADRSAQLFASPFRASADGPPQAILYLVDTSEQKALETQFAQSQKMQAIGQLAGGVAHDFNNLLQAIIGNCDLLLMRHAAGDPSFAEINEVRQNSVRAAGLVRQLLAFSRQQTLQPKVLALADTMTELSLLLRRLLGERINLKFEQAPDLWAVRADEGQISNAIVNLVVNARDAMPSEGGTVTIRTSNINLPVARPIGTGLMPAGDYVLIEVADTGQGIAPENQVKIFEPFFTTKPVGHGTGLGLSTVYGVVKQTGGFITVESELGKGAAFQVYLPRHVAAAAEATEEPDRTTHRDITGQDTILLVEDEDAVRSFAARALRMRGYTVLEAPGGEAALDIVRRHPGAIDLVISDVVMPNMDGPTMVRAATKLRPEMRVIFISGYAEDTFRRNEEKVEELHFLPKPFGLKQLVAKVKEVLSGAPPRRVTDALHDTGT
jgi:two-component system cell cycle sensor histidine kinase/response regulator CckA